MALSQSQINESGGPPPGYDKPGFEFKVAIPEQEDLSKDDKDENYTSSSG